MKHVDFRFYRTREKQMVYGFEGCSTTYVLNKWEEEMHVSRPMQFIGLEDISGKKVYSGDIIEYQDHDYFLRAVVESNYTGWYLKGLLPLENHDIHDFHDKGRAYFSVVGNVYENAELLED